MQFIKEKQNRVFIFLAAFFLTNAVVAEFMGVKIFSLEDTFGWSKFTFHLFGQEIKGFSLTCGVILWPFVFVFTDIINEYFGTRGVRFLSFIAAAMIAYTYVMLNLAIHVAPADWWIHTSQYGKDFDFSHAYNAVFGQGNNIIVGSLIAFMIGQITDVYIFHWVKKRTGEKYIWLRSTGSTFVSQFVDSYVVLFYAFYFAYRGTNQQWPLALVLAVGTVNYIYKFIMAFALTPLIYLIHGAIERYLGHNLAKRLKDEAARADD
ncbi:MAG: queuosine precursor transporter [Bacteroidetes bacterium]|nr:queuosine precursor transporter [Bacteroidota bacterium]